MTIPPGKKVPVDLMPEGVVDHELTQRMLDLFNFDPDIDWSLKELYVALNRPPHDFATRNTLVQLVVSNHVRRLEDYRFAARKDDNKPENPIATSC